MSVQVKRRREAAAFLAGFVGAQGELLVDTTNNRVQVHDGTTPGGWPAATVGDLAGRNALVNGTFAVNQRGYASGGSLAAGAYAHDRWKAGTAGAYTFAQTAPDTTVTITSGTLVQALEATNVYAAACWLTWLGTASARVWQGSASGTFSAGTKIAVGGVTVNALMVTGLTLGTIVNVEFSAGTLGLAQFEAALPNAGPTRFERRHLAQEIALCQRYYFQSVGAAANTMQINAYCQAGGYLVNTFAFPVQMRATPTTGLIGTYTYVNTNAFTIAAGSPSTFIGFCNANSTASTGAYNTSANSGFYASAEL